MTTQVQPTTVHEADMPRTRKRRAASLTAEALWNIQLEDDVTRGPREQDETNKKITLRENAKSVAEITSGREISIAKPRKTASNKLASVSVSCVKKQKPSGYLGKTKILPCVHNADESSYKNPPKVYRSKGKLTASVAPLVKSDHKPSPSLMDRKQLDNDQRNNTIARNSQVLLLPISLDPSVSTIRGGNHSVPLLTLHASPVNVDLMQCLDTRRIISPLMNVTPLLTGSSGAHASLISSDSTLRNTRYSTTTHNESRISMKDCKPVLSHQTEPLNLKLGESSIPSSSTAKTGKIVPCKRSYTVNNSARNQNKLFTSSTQRPSCLTTCNLGQSGQEFKTVISVSKFSKSSKARKCPGSSIVASDLTAYNAQSPSSESSCSTDFDDASVDCKKPKRSSKAQINLRCKAAPPPNENAQDLGNRLDDIKTFHAHKVTKVPTTRESSRDDTNNGWEWEGKPYEAHVYSVETAKPVLRRCYPAMRRAAETGVDDDDDDDDDNDCDVVRVRDCVMMRADGDEQAYVAKVAALWEHPKTGRMMISLLWFYRPEHTEDAKVHEQLDRYNDKELFASRHLDEISVACVEDKCYVLSYYQYCRFQAEERKDCHVGMQDNRDLIPSLPTPDPDFFPVKPHQQIPANTDQSLVFFCRKLYDIKLHRLLKSFSPPTSLFSIFGKSNYATTVAL